MTHQERLESYQQELGKAQQQLQSLQQQVQETQTLILRLQGAMVAMGEVIGDEPGDPALTVVEGGVE